MEKKEEKKEENQSSYIKIGIIISFIIVAIIILYYFIATLKFKAPTGAGEFGDMYGVVNSLFSGLAFVGLIIAILMQKEELKLQLEELEDTKEALNQQKTQLELQNETTRKQQFENTFFELLRLYKDTLNIKSKEFVEKLLGTGFVGEDKYQIILDLFRN